MSKKGRRQIRKLARALVDFKRQANWFEAERTKPSVPRGGEGFKPLHTETQDVKRQDLLDALCNELSQAGFTPAKDKIDRTARCRLVRVEEQKCFIQRARPHYL